jgi:hypothetical protein
MVWLLLACAEPAPPALHFVRGGLVRGGRFEARAWRPGEVVDEVIAPRIPECVPLFSVSLGDVSRHVAAGGEAPDTALVFSPDEQLLAIGTFDGELRVVDAWSGAERARRAWSEAMIKRLAWSPDGAVLWAGEQSPDGYVYALRAVDLEELGRFRIADELGGGEPAPGDDLYARYALPGVYGLAADAGGAWVVGAHGWTDADGVRRNRSRIWRLAAHGLGVLAAWPPDGPADAVFAGLATGGGALAIPVRRSAGGAPPPGIPVDGIALLDADLTPRSPVHIDVAKPWFSGVFIGDALALVGGEVWAGLGDGRVVVARADTGVVRAVLPLGMPDPAAELPLAATVGWLGPAAGRVAVVTTRAVIPYGAAAPDLRPPTLHPAENTVFALDRAGTPAWRWTGPHDLQGLVADDRWVVVGAGARQADDRRDLFGAVVLDAATGALAATCPTAGPVFFRPAMTSDGRIALAEVPFRSAGGVEGAWRVTVVR